MNLIRPLIIWNNMNLIRPLIIWNNMDLKSLLYGPNMVSYGPDKDLIRTSIDLERPYMDLIWSLLKYITSHIYLKWILIDLIRSYMDLKVPLDRDAHRPLLDRTRAF